MLGLTLREIILCAKSQHPLFTSDIIEAIRNRIKTHPLEVNQQGLFGFTPSHLAVIHNLPVILEALVVDGQADLTIPCQFKQTAVDLAASTPMKAFVGKLADKTQTIVGSIGLHLHELLANRQSFKSDMEFERAVKERVLAHPEEVNQKGFLGRNAIHLCAFYGHAELIPLILGMVSNADAHLKDELGLTAAELVPHHLSLIPALSSADAAHVKIVTPKIPKSATPPLVKKLAAWESDDQSLRDSELATYLSNLTLTDNEAHPGFKHDLRRLYLSQVIKEVNANRIQFIEAFLKEGYSIEELSEFVGENILAYCYHADLNFLFYLFYSFGGALGTQLTPKELQKRHQIFIVAQNSLLEQLNWQMLLKNQSEVVQHDAYVNSLLLQQSAVPNLQTGNLAMPSDTFFANCVKDNNLSAQLFKDLYQVCSYPPKGLDLDEISSILAAMANKYSLTELLIALRMLQKNFELSQKLISVFVLKELIAHYDPLSHRDIKFVMAVYAPSFFKGNPFKSFGPLLEKSAVLRMQSDDHRVNMYHTLEGLITQNIYNQSQTGFDTMFRLTNTSTSKQAKGVAEELRAYSLRLYQQLNIKELTTIKSKDKNRQQTAPSVFAIEQYFNLLSNYIVTKIITMDDLQQRARYVRLCVRICEALLGGDMPDYNSAMSVFAALNQASVVRLKKTFATLDKSTHDKLEVISTKLAQHGNYKEIRKVLAENQYAIPYLGIIASDLTFSQENTAFNTYAMMGKVIRQVATRINALKRVHLPLNSNIARTIRYLLPMDEKELFHLSLVQEPREPTQKADDGLIATQFERSRTSLALTQSTSDVSLNKGSTLKH